VSDPTTSLRYGQPAPEFSLPSTGGNPVTLAEFRGRADVVLAFYCCDWGRIDLIASRRAGA